MITHRTAKGDLPIGFARASVLLNWQQTKLLLPCSLLLYNAVRNSSAFGSEASSAFWVASLDDILGDVTSNNIPVFLSSMMYVMP
jgi:hypothetical protein